MKLHGLKVSLFVSVLLVVAVMLPVNYVLADIDQNNWVPEVLNEDPMTFTDLDETHRNYNDVKYLFERGFVEGYDDNTFRPDNSIVRAELMKILFAGMDNTDLDETKYRNCFPDVGTEWYAKYVCKAKELGLVSGYPDGTFKPEQYVNHVEALKMVMNSQGMNRNLRNVVEGEEWYVPYVEMGYVWGFLDDCDGSCQFVPGAFATRGEVSRYRVKAIEWFWSLV